MSLSGSMEGEIRACRTERGREKAGAEKTGVVVALDIPLQEVPDARAWGSVKSMWQRQTHFRPSSSFLSTRAIGWGSWMKRISEARSISAAFSPVHVDEEIKVVSGDGDVHAVQGVVHVLGNGEEPLVPFDHVPPGVDAQVLEEGDHPGQDLRHPAPDGRGVDVQDGLSLEL